MTKKEKIIDSSQDKENCKATNRENLQVSYSMAQSIVDHDHIMGAIELAIRLLIALFHLCIESNL